MIRWPKKLVLGGLFGGRNFGTDPTCLFLSWKNQLVGGFNPSEKYAQVKLGIISPNFGVKIPKIFELPPPSQRQVTFRNHPHVFLPDPKSGNWSTFFIEAQRFFSTNVSRSFNVQNFHMGVEPKTGGFYPQNGWFIVENPIKMDDLGGFPPIFGNTHISLKTLDSWPDYSKWPVPSLFEQSEPLLKGPTVDGWNPAKQLIGSFSHYL